MRSVSGICVVLLGSKLLKFNLQTPTALLLFDGLRFLLVYELKNPEGRAILLMFYAWDIPRATENLIVSLLLFAIGATVCMSACQSAIYCILMGSGHGEKRRGYLYLPTCFSFL